MKVSANNVKRVKETAKIGLLVLVCMGTVGACLLSVPAYAKSLEEKIGLAAVDAEKLASGYRTSKIMGSAVYNDNGDQVGTVDDLIISSQDAKAPYVVISVGGFLGIGAHLVAVPYGSLRLDNYKIILAEATKEELKALPEFKYTPD